MRDCRFFNKMIYIAVYFNIFRLNQTCKLILINISFSCYRAQCYFIKYQRKFIIIFINRKCYNRSDYSKMRFMYPFNTSII